MGSGASGLQISETIRSELKNNVPTITTNQSNKPKDLEEVKRIRKQLHHFHSEIIQEEARKLDLSLRRSTGKVKIIYERYSDIFNLIDNKINIAAIDAEYCLSDIMPNCTLELLTCSLKDRIQSEITGTYHPFCSKDSLGNWIDIFTYDDEPKTYWIRVFQDKEQRELDLKKTKERIDAANAKEKEGDGERVEGCSCLGEFYSCFFFFPIFSSKSNTHLTILIF